MDEKAIYSYLGELFRDVFMRDDLVLTPELSAKDVGGWDSFRQIEIVMAVEEHYGIKFHTRESDKMRNVGDLVRTIIAKG